MIKNCGLPQGSGLVLTHRRDSAPLSGSFHRLLLHHGLWPVPVFCHTASAGPLQWRGYALVNLETHPCFQLDRCQDIRCLGLLSGTGRLKCSVQGWFSKEFSRMFIPWKTVRTHMIVKVVFTFALQTRRETAKWLQTAFLLKWCLLRSTHADEIMKSFL